MVFIFSSLLKVYILWGHLPVEKNLWCQNHPEQYQKICDQFLLKSYSIFFAYESIASRAFFISEYSFCKASTIISCDENFSEQKTPTSSIIKLLY